MAIAYAAQCPKCPEKIDLPVEVKLTRSPSPTDRGLTLQCEVASIDITPMDQHYANEHAIVIHDNRNK